MFKRIPNFLRLKIRLKILFITIGRMSFFAKWFRKSKSTKNGTLSGQFPPIEWFNSKIVHLQNAATQTCNSVTILLTEYVKINARVSLKYFIRNVTF